MNIKFVYPICYDEYTENWNICSGGFVYVTLKQFYDKQ